jgi:LPXTG-site transpeptidase (sortase) family protein
MPKRRRDLPLSSDLRAHILVLLSLLGALVVAAGIATPTGGDLVPGQASPPSFFGGPVEEPVEPPQDPGGEDVLYIPAIDLHAPIEDIEMDAAGVLSPPADTDVVGWWQRSAEPGARRGQTVITGHTVHDGGGVMNDLGELVPGDVVRLRDDNKVVEYRVTDTATLSLQEVADNAQMLFGQDREKGRLVLVTCTDWVDGDYLSNLIVVAEPVRGSSVDG